MMLLCSEAILIAFPAFLNGFLFFKKSKYNIAISKHSKIVPTCITIEVHVDTPVTLIPDTVMKSQSYKSSP